MENQEFDKRNFSASGITISTVNPIYVGNSRKSYDDYYLNLDASSNSSEISAFQEWLNKNYAGWAKGYSNGIVLPVNSGYGSFGSLTQAAWSKYGNQYLASLPPTTASTTTTATTQPTESQIKEAAKKGMVWDNINKKFSDAKASGLLDTILGIFGGSKPQKSTSMGQTQQQTKDDDGKGKMSTGVKIAIGVGALMLVGGIIYAVTKKNK